MRLRRRDQRRDQRGAVLVEAAFVFPILVLLVFGVIEYGMTFKDSLTLSSSTRAGVRTASSLARVDTYGADTVAAVSVAMEAISNDAPQTLVIFKAVNGKPMGTVDSCTSCLRYTWNQSTSAWGAPTGTWSALTHNACVGSNGPPDEVGVYIKARHTFLTGLFGDGITLTDTTIMRFEPRTISEGCAAL
jgi:Flp pilus assembly protein TadG